MLVEIAHLTPNLITTSIDSRARFDRFVHHRSSPPTTNEQLQQLTTTAARSGGVYIYGQIPLAAAVIHRQTSNKHNRHDQAPSTTAVGSSPRVVVGMRLPRHAARAPRHRPPLAWGGPALHPRPRLLRLAPGSRALAARDGHGKSAVPPALCGLPPLAPSRGARGGGGRPRRGPQARPGELAAARLCLCGGEHAGVPPLLPDREPGPLAVMV